MTRRLVAAVLAVVMAWPIGVTVVRRNEALAICAIYTPDQPEYYVFFCYLGK